MRASASALQPCSASNRCARRQQVGFLLHCSLAALKLMRAASCKPVFCSDTRDAMAHAAFPCRCTRLHTRREAVQCSAHSQCTLCNRPHGWKGVDLRCRRSPRSELEVFYARNEFTVLASSSHFVLPAAGAKRARASILNLSALVIACRLIVEDNCKRSAASRALTWSTHCHRAAAAAEPRAVKRRRRGLTSNS